VTPRHIIGVEKNYDWGDETTIRHAQGLPSTRGTKIAELWFGTHPMGPARLGAALGNETLGAGQMRAVGSALGLDGDSLASVTGDMTMLVKLLACAEPLSLQTHPTLEQAREGFAREEALGIPRDAPNRMYRDESDKPEMIVALSRFEALCGFAPVDESVGFLADIGWQTESDFLKDHGIAAYIEWSFAQTDAKPATTAPGWLASLARLHGSDPALRIAPLLNHVVLQEGEALLLPAGNLHAYLHGFGLEVMKSSDNVIRAGFTPKHIDVAELMRVVDTSPLPMPVTTAHPDGTYPSPSSAFSVGTISTVDDRIDCHRVVWGLERNPDSRVTHPGAYLVPAGESGLDWFADGWVCTQL
jgi:mannose-6-phosphate isomerase